MSSKKIVPPPPGFPRPLAEISPSGRIIMHDHKRKASERTFLGQRRSSRQKNSPDLFVPAHPQLSPRPRGQGLRRRPGRPRKNRSDESSASQPLRCGPGHPRKKRSNVTEVLEISSDEEETKSNAKLSRLMHPPKTNPSPQILDEEMVKVMVNVESLLVKKLLASANDVDSMVHQANTTFGYLKGFGVDYGSFYRDITEYITHCCNLQDAKREETMLSFTALQKDYVNASVATYAVSQDFGGTQRKLEFAKEKKETLKRQIEDLKTEIAKIEHEEERLKYGEIKYKEAYEAAKAKMKELDTQLEAAQAERGKITHRKNVALQGIESTTQRLLSRFLDDLN
ncbi:hypothetical protein HAX54_030982 [Datura stramonium]|uniref:Uncharacterized protein n=1 Tax=Datura stramonium TaxID=4076 RepID=A0ABS8V8X0_DATST|nr:hypothetical protein [Datura stramonium]